MKILIPNASSSKNVGDLAILTSLLHFLNGNFSTADITIHSADPNSLTTIVFKPIKHTLYSWAVFENKNLFIRTFRCLQLLLSFILFKNGVVTVPVQKRLREIINDYRLSEFIIFTGGGYLRTQGGLLQSLNLLMQLFMIAFAKTWGGKIIVMPMSFGPFAYKWQERLASHVLKDVSNVFIRENISFDSLKSYNLQNIILSNDLAFLLPIQNKNEKNKNLILGFTVRKWLQENKQKKFENQISQALINVARLKNVSIQPIIQVDAPEFGDSDIGSTNKIINNLKNEGISVLESIKIENLDQAFAVYGSLDLLVGMRMHSNILASLIGVPFFAISYEYKTEGICKSLGNKFYLTVEDILLGKLSDRVLEFFTDRDALAKSNSEAIVRIRQELSKQLLAVLKPTQTKELLSVSLGIAAYKTGSGIVPLVRALLAQKQGAYILDKIYVHIDGDEDETFALVTEFSQKNPNVVVMQTLPRKGFANAFITLMQKPQSNVTILINDDIKVEDGHLVEKLIKPFYEYENVGLVCGHPEPLPPVSFVDRAITTSHFAWDTMRMHMQQGHNAFTVDGKIMAMSKSFIEKVDIPKNLADMGNVDAYIYLECKRLGYTYKYVRDARVAYRNPTTVAEHFKWGIRNNANQHRYKKKFGSLVKEKYEKPKLLYISSLGGQFVRNPLGALFIFLSGFYIRGKSKSYAKNFNQMWSVLETSKKLGNEK